MSEQALFPWAPSLDQKPAKVRAKKVSLPEVPKPAIVPRAQRPVESKWVDGRMMYRGHEGFWYWTHRQPDTVSNFVLVPWRGMWMQAAVILRAEGRIGVIPGYTRRVIWLYEKDESRVWNRQTSRCGIHVTEDLRKKAAA